MANELFNDDLFSSNLDSKMDFLNDKSASRSDGIYRIDLTKIKDKKKGYRSVIRFLPNLQKDGKLGQSAIEKITHYVDIKNQKDLSGWFDSAKNWNERCELTDLFYQMQNSKNAILIEKSKCLKYSKKYYSYVLILEDDQQPDLVGKIMILQYGKTLRDKILSEKNGEISGKSINVFSLSEGKDFVLLVKEIQTGDDTYPDYKNSMFKQETSPISIFIEEKAVFKMIPLVSGNIDTKFQQPVKYFLLKREHELEEFSPKRLSEEQQSKLTEVKLYLTGKSSNSYKKENIKSDFDYSEDTHEEPADFTPTAPSKSTDDDDDFFKF